MILCSKSAKGLQKQIDCFRHYCKLWHLIGSLKKTKIVIYNSLYAKLDCVFKYGSEIIEICDTYKYLGLWCGNTNNTFIQNYSYLSDKAYSAIFAIKNYSFSTLGKLTPKLALKTFNTQISPILLYGAEVMYTGKEIGPIHRFN